MLNLREYPSHFFYKIIHHLLLLLLWAKRHGWW